MAWHGMAIQLSAEPPRKWIASHADGGVCSSETEIADNTDFFEDRSSPSKMALC